MLYFRTVFATILQTRINVFMAVKNLRIFSQLLLIDLNFVFDPCFVGLVLIRTSYKLYLLRGGAKVSDLALEFADLS